MQRDPRLERYLTTLESSLKPFPVSDRAEIITEIKSHVDAALERDPQANVETILAALGEPEIVANRYLLERGLKPSKPPISPIVRWIVIGFLGTLAMLLVFSAFVIAQFSPIVKVDEAANKVELLGGIIKVDGENERISVKSFVDGGQNTFAGTDLLTEGQELLVKFKNGRVEVTTAKDANFTYECRSNSRDDAAQNQWDGGATLDLTTMNKVNCDLEVPAGVKLRIEGENGRIAIEDADFDVDADLERGHLEFGAKKNALFKYDVKVQSGAADTFESSTDPKARTARLNVGSGRISKDD